MRFLRFRGLNICGFEEFKMSDVEEYRCGVLESVKGFYMVLFNFFDFL